MPGIEIGVRYCGGCNPTYNRASLVKRLESMMPDLSFVNVQPGKSYPAVLIVSGCLVACTKVDDLSVPGERQIQIRSFSDLLPTRDRIRELLIEEEALTLDRAQIVSILPHRPPMLFVDSVSRLVPGKEAAAELYVDPKWDIFRGHFPENPVFPGVLTTEAMAQTADLMVMTKDIYAGKEPLLMEIGRVRFRRRILPGTALQLRAALKEEHADTGIVVCRCQALAEDKICAEAEITLAMR